MQGSDSSSPGGIAIRPQEQSQNIIPPALVHWAPPSHETRPVAQLQAHRPHHDGMGNTDPILQTLIPIHTIWHNVCCNIPFLTKSPQHAQPPQPSHRNKRTNSKQLQIVKTQWAQLFQSSRRAQEQQATDINRPIIMSIENQCANEPPWVVCYRKKPSIVFAYTGECQHGLSLDRRGGQFDTPCEVQKEVQADILCGQEHNLDSDKTHVRSILYYTC